ncbi:MAG TPA: hypothetical protein VM183_03445 [Burkholderiales bacterium]|nr:hypothetical protein [Burkholderiales bacterium]
MRGAVLAVFALICLSASAAPGSAIPVETMGLRSIAGWLQAKGQPGYVGADVADAIGIPRDADLVDAMQRGFREEEILRVAQVIGPDTLLFTVQADGEVYFYLSNIRGGLRKALLSVPTRESVVTLDGTEAQASFLREVRYWEGKAAAR